MKIFWIACLSSLLLLTCSKDDSPTDEPDSTVIHHFDWNPDLIVLDSILIDLNQDNVDDLMLHVEKRYEGTRPNGGPYYNYFAWVKALNSATKVSAGVSSQNACDCIEHDESIDSALTWEDTIELRGSVIAAGAIGYWDNSTPHGYVGLKMESGSSTYYGWLKTDVSEDSSLDRRYSFTCYAYGMSETANGTIKAGQTN